jgi:predicted O-methyltransferase YrrM
MRTRAVLATLVALLAITGPSVLLIVVAASVEDGARMTVLIAAVLWPILMATVVLGAGLTLRATLRSERRTAAVAAMLQKHSAAMKQHSLAMTKQADARAAFESALKRDACEFVATAANLRVRLDAQEVHLAKIREKLGNGTNSVAAQIRQAVLRDTAAFSTLHMMLDVAASSVPTTGWEALPSTLLAIVERVKALPQGSVFLETGSGLSTVWAGLAAQTGTGIRVIALEHSERWEQQTRRALELNGLTEVVELRLAPLRTEASLGDVLWYSSDGWDDLGAIDLAFIDGPPGASGPNARRPAIDFLRTRVKPGSVIMVDDANRAEEKGIVDELVSMSLGGLGVRVIEERERLAVLEVFDPADQRDAP